MARPWDSDRREATRCTWRYETYDLAPLLRAGNNVLAATVWNMGSDAPVAQQTTNGLSRSR